MNLDKYAEQKARDACLELMPHVDNSQLRTLLIKLIKEVARDQKHGCAEAVNALESGKLVPHGRDYISTDRAHQAVMNAEPKAPGGER